MSVSFIKLAVIFIVPNHVLVNSQRVFSLLIALFVSGLALLPLLYHQLTSELLVGWSSAYVKQ